MVMCTARIHRFSLKTWKSKPKVSVFLIARNEKQYSGVKVSVLPLLIIYFLQQKTKQQTKLIKILWLKKVSGFLHHHGFHLTKCHI